MPLKNVRQRKNELRAVYKRIRVQCPQDIRQSLDRQLAENFWELEEYKACKTLFVFVSTPIEVDTSAIISKALADGKKLAVPKCRDKNGKMDFYYIDSLECLEVGAYSIMEPDEKKCEKVTDLSEGLCIVPGLCFDFQGYRLGFGKGYYDRFLQNFKGTTVGLCYSRCTERELPKGIYDRAVDILVTEKFTNYTKNVFSKE